MRFKQLKIKTSLSIMVLLLSALTLVAVALGWYSQQQTQSTLQGLIATGVSANANVNNAYVNVLLAVNQIDAAIRMDDINTRDHALGNADKLLEVSRARLKAFLSAANLTGSDGAAVKQSLSETFESSWALALQLRSLAEKQDIVGYETVEQSQAPKAAQAIEAAFSKFDTLMQSQNSQTAQAIANDFARSRYVYAGLVAIALLLACLAYLTLSRMVFRPLKRVQKYFAHIAAGDLTQRIDASSRNEIGLLYVDLKRMQDSLVRSIEAVRNGTQHISSRSAKIVAGNTDLSSRTEEQAAALQETAASLEELSSTVKQNADNARQANQLAATASEVAQRGGGAVDEVVTTMQGISASSRKISDIVGVIDSIAFQTNILALNAAVEAARAGEQGKGFAVVAAEVRALAQRSAQAAKEIKGLIEGSAKKVTEGSSQVERAGATMQEIVTSVARVTDIMGEISAATTEQSTGIDEINRAVGQMDLVTQQNAMLVEQAALSASDLSEQVTHVIDAVSLFKTASSQVIDVPATTVKLAATGNGASGVIGSDVGVKSLSNNGSASAALPLNAPKRGASFFDPPPRPVGVAAAVKSASIPPAPRGPLTADQKAPAAYAASAAANNDDDWVEF